MNKASITVKIHKLLQEYYAIDKAQSSFITGKTPIQYAGAVYDHRELQAMTDVMLKGWFGLGEQGELLESELAAYLGAKKAFLVNSGSSADLVAVSALTSYQFPEHLNPGDEVITPACTFPTVVSAIVHCGLTPVFVDVDPETLNPRPEDIEKAITKKSRLILLVHTLGNPNDMDPIMKIAREHKLFVIEDNCDALGSTYKGRKTGTFGILSTESFYPAHHMTTAGEGGAVFLNDLQFLRIVQSIREWGRACWCGAAGGGVNGVCGVRFQYRIGGTPYDHKYIWSNLGYNLKPIEIQAAMGRVQLTKVDGFIEKRKYNFQQLQNFFKQYERFFILPKAMSGSDPSWFAYPITIRDGAPFNRFTMTQFLEGNHIQTRPLFAGNITRQPIIKQIKYKVKGTLKNSDRIFFNSFFVGIYPGITELHLAYMKEQLTEFLNKY